MPCVKCGSSTTLSAPQGETDWEVSWGEYKNWLQKELVLFPALSLAVCGTWAQLPCLCEFLFSYLQNSMVILICEA